MGNTLFVIVLGTVLATRLFLRVMPIASPVVWGLKLHHYMYGILIAALGISVNSVTLLAVGLGLVVDEFGFVLVGGETWSDYHSYSSLSGTAIGIAFLFVFRGQLAALL